ncbi:exonuclease domain-containing protein [Thalassococcus sp. BH17M4-6]|uniref:3'-5' exonuclease n=1 Tax=Thalassococcus sp. BH17M4-6 TaxID=3413148 RepID=UPI003BCBABF1
MPRVGLRLRVFLTFLGLAAGALAILALALWGGQNRAETGTNGYLFAFILGGFGLVGLIAGVWLMLDETLAKPVERIAADLRSRAHAGLDRPIDADLARHLGDLAPAADAITKALSESTVATARQVAAETARLSSETARLTALLTEIPVATILVSAEDRIVLYDGQAAGVLAQIAVPRLGARISAYFDPRAMQAAKGKLARSGMDVNFAAQGIDGAQSFEMKMKYMDGGGYLLIIDAATARIAPQADRPLVYDFTLLDRPAASDIAETPLRELCFAVFDTETTGLLPHKDEIVQIGALRILGGRLVEGEVLDMLVDPGRPIPAGATKVHGITDHMVAGKPDVQEAARRFHHFCEDAVIVAHNAPFDMAFLRRHAAAGGLSWDHPILDTVLLSAVLFGASAEHTLDALCQRLDVTLPARDRHTALGDARATAAVLLRMLPMLEARGLETFGKVLEETRRHGRLLEDLN